MRSHRAFGAVIVAAVALLGGGRAQATEALAIHLVRLAEVEASITRSGCEGVQAVLALDAVERRVLERGSGLLRHGVWPSAAFRTIASDLASLDGHALDSPGVPWGAPAAAVREADAALGAMVAAMGAPGDDAEVERRLFSLRDATCRGERYLVRLLVAAEREFDPSLRSRPVREQVLQVLSAVGSPADWLGRLLPRHPDYLALVRGLAKYRWAVEQGGWSHWTLADRLRFEGWLGREGDVGEAAVVLARAEYQRAAGLEATGVLDAPTRSELSAPAPQRVAQIRLALTKWRQSAFRKHDTLIWVNLPTFMTELWVAGSREREYRSVIGAPADPTPTLTRDIHTVQYNPPWFVPPAVVREELMPASDSDPDFLTRNGFRRYRDRHGAFRVVQAAGEGNWLGRAILRWSARDAIFIHGSPFEERFAASARALSHGCVNVENVEQLAARLLEIGGSSAAEAEDWLASGTTRKLRLSRSIPAVIDYIAVSADAQGRLRFHVDVYGRDAEALRVYWDAEHTAQGDDAPAAPTSL